MAGRRKKGLIIAAAVAVFLLVAALFAGLEFYRLIRVVHHQEKLLGEMAAATQVEATPDYGWMELGTPVIAHAMGRIGEHDYTNSREAFEANYALGQRIFEVDFRITDVMGLVCVHNEKNWRTANGLPEDTPFTMEAFTRSRLYGELTPLRGEEIIDLMAEYPDIYFVTDTKYTDRTLVQLMFSALTAYAKKNAPETLDRLIPQIYNENMYTYVMDVYPFRSLIYTLYATETTASLACDFCDATNVKFITIPKQKADARTIALVKSRGIGLGVHTVNDAEEARTLLASGVDMIYSDYLTAAALEE